MFQNKWESEFGSIRDPQDDPARKACRVALDDPKVSSAIYEDHVRQVSLVLDKAVLHRGWNFGEQDLLGSSRGRILGCTLVVEGRRPAASKAQQLFEWAEYPGLEDIRGYVYFVEYLEGHLPTLPSVIAPLRPYLETGSRFKDYLGDPAPQAA